MGSSIVLMLLLQVILILLNAFFACAEIAVLSVKDARLAHLAAEGDKRAVRLARLTSEPARFLATIQVAITLSGFLGSAFAADNFSELLTDGLLRLGIPLSAATLDTISVILITIVLSYFSLVFGELVPKRIAMRKAEKIALLMSAPVTAISKLFRPLVALLTASTNGVLRLLGIDPSTEDDAVSEEEIRLMVDAGSQNGAIDQEEQQFIENVFEFDDLTAGEIATHRTEVSLLWMEEPMEVWRETILRTHFTRYVVCDGSSDNVVGVLNTKDLFRLPDQSRESVLAHAVKPAYFVPESVKADVLFRNMKKSRSKLAVVLDEYGGMEGIVTMNDLIEQLVGDLGDEHTAELPEIEKTGERTWRVRGTAPLRELSDAVGLELESDEYDTLTGLVFSRLGAVPDDGETDVALDLGRLHIRVNAIRDHQVESADLTVDAPPAPERDED